MQRRVLELLKRFGWNVTSFQILEPGFRYWFADEHACVAYVDTGRAWVAAGAPIAAPERLAEVAERFVATAAQAGRRACFFATERRCAELTPLHRLAIGEQAVWDPAAWTAGLKQVRSLREQLRRARKKGVRIRALSSAELGDPGSAARQALEALTRRWLGSRPMAPMGFVVQLHLFGYPEERRCFVAERDGQVVGALGVVPVYARGGWFLEDLLRTSDAPNGTAELLVDAAMQAAAAEGVRFATLGLAPLSGVPTGWLRAARQFSAGLYDFEGLRAFKAKLRPQSWEPVYVSHPAGQRELWTIYDVLAAFSAEGLLVFGLRTLLRAPAIVVRLLALPLLPWTVVLAGLDGRWFPSPAVQRLWVGFDAMLFVGLLWLSQRWRFWLGTALAGLVSLDAALTMAEVALFNLGRVQSPLEYVPLLLAALVPSAAAILLWAGRVHREAAEA